jgi:hypothetical protein
MRLLILLLCSAFAFGQDAAPVNASKQKSALQYGLGLGTIGRTVEGIEILSNTPGVELAPYLRIVVPKINQNCRDQIPDPRTERENSRLSLPLRRMANWQICGSCRDPVDLTMRLWSVWLGPASQSPTPFLRYQSNLPDHFSLSAFTSTTAEDDPKSPLTAYPGKMRVIDQRVTVAKS